MKSLGGTPPEFAHHSLLTGPQGEALSKRLGTLSLRDLRANGIEPMAILSLMARLGSSKPVELAGSIRDLIDGFEIGSFGAAPTKFDAEDLKPLTRAWVQRLPLVAVADRLAALGVPADVQPDFWAVASQNIDVLGDLDRWWTLCRDGAEPVIADEDADFVREALALLPARPWGPDSWSQWTNAVKAATGRKGKGLFMPLRRALTGMDHGPEMAALMPLLQVVRAL